MTLFSNLGRIITGFNRCCVVLRSLFRLTTRLRHAKHVQSSTFFEREHVRVEPMQDRECFRSNPADQFTVSGIEGFHLTC